MTLESGAPAGITIVAGTPNAFAASATPCAWLPAEEAITPLWRSSGFRLAIFKEDYIKLLHSFYDDFAENLAKVKKEMEGVKIQLKEDQTDIPCEKCGRMMVVKVGRFGKFLACPAYPECKTTKPFVKETGGKCPKCGGKIVERRSKKGRVFYGCDNWPTCDFVTWDAPAGENCPKCGKSLFKSRTGVISCLADGCDYKTKAKKK